MFIFSKLFIAVALAVELHACSSNFTFNTANITCSIPSTYQSQQCLPKFDSCTITAGNSSQTYHDKLFCRQACCQNQTPACPPSPTPKNSTPSLHILISVVAVLASLAITVILCYRCKQYRAIVRDRCCCCWRGSTVANQPQHHVVTQTSFDEIAVKGWKRDQIGLEMMDCPVCLCDYPNILTDCRHSYHALCLRQCLLRKFQCVLCRNTGIQHVRIYCTKCLHYYIRSHILDFYSPNIDKAICKICTDDIKFSDQ